MFFKPYPGTRKEIDLLTAIAPVFRLDRENRRINLIGTGFWVTTSGHLVTAWHVVSENIGPDGQDRGPIFAVQTLPDHSVAVRNFRKTDRHPLFDLALSETVPAQPGVGSPSTPIAMSLDALNIGQPVFSFAVLPHDQVFKNEVLPGITTETFSAEISVPLFADRTPIKFSVRLSFGKITDIFEQMRDRIMLPFPCVQSDVPIYGGNSGGPVFDVRGRICAINCTSFDGNDVSFHIPVHGVLHLRTNCRSLGLEVSSRTQRSIIELATSGIVLFDPPVLDPDRVARSILQWLWYALKCLIRGEWPSTNFHFCTTKEASTRLSEDA